MNGAKTSPPLYVFTLPLFERRLVLFVTSIVMVERFQTILRQATPFRGYDSLNFYSAFPQLVSQTTD
jgi:hypothetical protein